MTQKIELAPGRGWPGAGRTGRRKDHDHAPKQALQAPQLLVGESLQPASCALPSCVPRFDAKRRACELDSIAASGDDSREQFARGGPCMSQRILERGQIETLASRSIPRIRLPDAIHLFAQRAERLRALAADSPIGDYLQMLAVISDAQHALLQDPQFIADAAAIDRDDAAISQARQAQMPQVPASDRAARPQRWLQALQAICAAIQADGEVPAPAKAIAGRVGLAGADWLHGQADALLATGADGPEVDGAAAPLVMAALQVSWVAIASGFDVDLLQPMPDAPGLCPLCGTAPVASVVHARAPYQAYRYLHCALCACEWHQVRVHCSHCGAGGKDIAYRSLLRIDAGDDANADDNAVRAETCEQCQGYRKIMYVEKDPQVDPVADDLGTLALDLLLGDQGYARFSGNPLLWQAGDDH